MIFRTSNRLLEEIKSKDDNIMRWEKCIAKGDDLLGAREGHCAACFHHAEQFDIIKHKSIDIVLVVGGYCEGYLSTSPIASSLSNLPTLEWKHTQVCIHHEPFFTSANDDAAKVHEQESENEKMRKLEEEEHEECQHKWNTKSIFTVDGATLTSMCDNCALLFGGLDELYERRNNMFQITVSCKRAKAKHISLKPLQNSNISSINKDNNVVSIINRDNADMFKGENWEHIEEEEEEESSELLLCDCIVHVKEIITWGDIPSVRSRHAAGSCESLQTLYIFGGESDEEDQLNDMYSFTLPSRMWRRIDHSSNNYYNNYNKNLLPINNKSTLWCSESEHKIISNNNNSNSISNGSIGDINHSSNKCDLNKNNSLYHQNVNSKLTLENSNSRDYLEPLTPNMSWPPARFNTSSLLFVHNRFIIMYGGAHFVHGNLESLNDVWLFDLNTEMWREVEKGKHNVFMSECHLHSSQWPRCNGHVGAVLFSRSNDTFHVHKNNISNSISTGYFVGGKDVSTGCNAIKCIHVSQSSTCKLSLKQPFTLPTNQRNIDTCAWCHNMWYHVQHNLRHLDSNKSDCEIHTSLNSISNSEFHTNVASQYEGEEEEEEVEEEVVINDVAWPVWRYNSAMVAIPYNRLLLLAGQCRHPQPTSSFVLYIEEEETKLSNNDDVNDELQQ